MSSSIFVRPKSGVCKESGEIFGNNKIGWLVSQEKELIEGIVFA